jgi:hypothetical protein
MGRGGEEDGKAGVLKQLRDIDRMRFTSLPIQEIAAASI